MQDWSEADAGDLPDPDADEVIDDPYPFYAVLRDRYPVHRHPRTGEYLLTRYRDVQAVTADPATFSSQVQAESHDHMASLDPPRHDLHRASVASVFHARRIADMRQRVEERAAALLAPLAHAGRLDLGSEVAAVLPGDVITAMVGIPDELRERFRLLALSITTLGGTAAVYRAIADLQALAREAVDGYRLPEDGILASLVRLASTPGSELTMADAVGVCTNLVLAGTDTATNLITNAAVFLGRRPDIRRRLLAEPSLVDDTVEEMLRLESPVQWLSRRTTRPSELHGRPVAAGSVLRLYWGAANRDERAVARPDAFELGRPRHRHLAFGYGLHFCIGAALARLEARVALCELLALAPEYVIDEEGLVRVRSSMFRGYEHVPLAAGA